MKLFKKFNEKAKALGDKHRENKKARRLKRREQEKAYINARLEELAGRLPHAIKTARFRDQQAVEFLTNELRDRDPKKFSGYKALHKVCAAANSGIEVRTVWTGSFAYGSTPYLETYIVLRPNKPYADSPDAYFYAPKQNNKEMTRGFN